MRELQARVVQEAQEDLADPEEQEVNSLRMTLDSEVIETKVVGRTYWGGVSKPTSWISSLPFDPVQTRPTLETSGDMTKSWESRED